MHATQLEDFAAPRWQIAQCVLQRDVDFRFDDATIASRLRDGFRRTFTYSNLMYGALGHVFPELVDDTWQRFVSRNLVDPLGLTSTSLRPASSETDVALPYSGTRRIASVDLTSIAAAGGMKSSLEDMIRWMRFQLGDGRAPSGAQLHQ